MTLNIKDAETDRLVRELADATGESITTAVRVAVADRLQRVRRASTAHERRMVLTEIYERGQCRPTLDDRTEDEILGYDDLGLPR